MASLKDLKWAEKTAVEQQRVLAELKTLAVDIERCEKTIVTLNSELEGVNRKHQGRRTTREDIAYLEDLLKCAQRKLAWEKQIASLQKRTPAILENMARLLNDPKSPPSEEVRAEMLAALQQVQAVMDRLQNVKME